MPISNSSSNSSQGTSSNQVSSYSYSFTDDSAATILSENQNRKGISIYNDLSAEVYIDVGSNQFSSGTYMLALPMKELYEMPTPVFKGAVGAHTVTGGATGKLLVREFE